MISLIKNVGLYHKLSVETNYIDLWLFLDIPDAKERFKAKAKYRPWNANYTILSFFRLSFLIWCFFSLKLMRDITHFDFRPFVLKCYHSEVFQKQNSGGQKRIKLRPKVNLRCLKALLIYVKLSKLLRDIRRLYLSLLLLF